MSDDARREALERYTDFAATRRNHPEMAWTAEDRRLAIAVMDELVRLLREDAGLVPLDAKAVEAWLTDMYGLRPVEMVPSLANELVERFGRPAGRGEGLGGNAATVVACPICYGHGVLPYPEGVPAGMPFVSSSCGPWPCHYCKGAKVVSRMSVEAAGRGEEPPGRGPEVAQRRAGTRRWCAHVQPDRGR